MMKNDTVQWLVVTDLDGTMLNHDNYEVDAATSAVRHLQKKNIPIVFNTSKTYAESISIRKTLAIDDAFIVENGSCVYLPKAKFKKPAGSTERDDYWSLVLGATQQEIENTLQAIGLATVDAVRLSRCDVEQAVALTGLSEEQAEQAIVREFSEPLIWQSDSASLEHFQQQLTWHGMTTLQGGRFLHVIGDCDKGRAMQALMRCYPGKVKTIVLGDSANDAAMLAVADMSFVVLSPSNHRLVKLVSADYITQQPAPSGWCEAIDHAMKLINLEND